MKSLTRAPHGASDALSRSISHPYVCASCRQQISRKWHPKLQQVRQASQQNLPFTEKLRRKIWGTDNPPGLADPYGGPGIIESRWKRRQEERRVRPATTEDELPEDIMAPLEAQESEQGELIELPELEEYKEATTWDGLRHLGHQGRWTDFPPQPEDHFTPWIDSSQRQAPSRAELLSCLYQAIVECLMHKETGKAPAPVSDADFSSAPYDAIFSTKVVLSESGTLSHVEPRGGAATETLLTPAGQTEKQPEASPDQEPYQDVHTKIHVANREVQDLADEIHTVQYADDKIENLNQEPQTVPATHEAASRLTPSGTVPDENFLSATLDFKDPITFKILKRFSQLSQHRIPDPVLNALARPDSSKNLSFLIISLTKALQPKPKNVAESLMQEPALTRQSNVTILSRRETPVDKEKEVGRWKVIEKELRSRGLPVLGRVSA